MDQMLRMIHTCSIACGNLNIPINLSSMQINFEAEMKALFEAYKEKMNFFTRNFLAFTYSST